MIKIHHIEPDLFLKEKIAIVGSSSRLIQRNYGYLIDSFEEVVRFNRAPITHFEQNVGSFCTLRVANNHVFDNVDISDWSNGQPKDFIKDLRNQRVLLISPDMMPWIRRNQNTHHSCPLFKFDYSKMSSLKYDVGFDVAENMSVGLTFVCLSIISGLKPVLFGFDFEENSERSHYWEKIGPSGNCHNQIFEKELLRNFDREGFIELVL